MCGIFGIAFNRDHIMFNKKRQLKVLVRELFEQTESRGKIATGIAAMNRHKATFMKQKMIASDFVEKQEFENFMDEVLLFEDPKTNTGNPICSIIGHCRLNTKGTPDRNVNNHPIVSGSVIGVHNGSISNDDTLFGRFKDYFKTSRAGEVDSEIIFQMINHFYNLDIGACMTGDRWQVGEEAIKRTTSLLEGGYACAMINTKEPYRLYLFRNQLPITIRYYTTLGITIFASVDTFITSAMNNIFGEELNENVEIDIPPKSGVMLDVDHNKYHSFNLERAQGAY